jgi:hypothetical protein
MAQSNIRGKIRDRFSWIPFTLSEPQPVMPISLLLSLVTGRSLRSRKPVDFPLMLIVPGCCLRTPKLPKAFERGLHAAADVIKRHGKASDSGSVNSMVVEEEIPVAMVEIFNGELTRTL